MVVFGPAASAGITCFRSSQMSPDADVCVTVGSTEMGCVGNSIGVAVGGEVGIGVSVGGMSVAVGIAAWVSATIVQAAATAVPWTSAALIVGSGSGPQALNRNKLANMRVMSFFIFDVTLQSINIHLAIWRTACLEYDAVIFNPETVVSGPCNCIPAECLEILLSIDKGRCPESSNGNTYSGRTVEGS